MKTIEINVGSYFWVYIDGSALNKIKVLGKILESPGDFVCGVLTLNSETGAIVRKSVPLHNFIERATSLDVSCCIKNCQDRLSHF